MAGPPGPPAPRRGALDPGVDRRLAELAATQAGVVSRRQLRLIGVSAKQVSVQVNAGRWRPLSPVVMAVHRGPLPPTARRWAAVLHAGQHAALGAWTALEEWGLRGWERHQIHVVVPHGSGRTGLLDAGPVVVHESRRLDHGEARLRHGLPLLTVARAAVDAAAWSRDDRQAAGLLAAVVQQGLASPTGLRTELGRAGQVRRRRLLAGVIADIEGGSHSLSEADFVRFCARFGLPAPLQQQARLDSTGRRRYLDAQLRRPDGRILHVEVDGVGHLSVGQWYDDLLRGLELASFDGPLQVRIPSLALRTEPARLAAALRRLLR